MPAAVPPLHRLTGPERNAARLDGDLFELGSGYLPADAADTAPLRAATLHELLAPDLAAVGMSAAWVHLATDAEPEPHVAQSIDPARRRHAQVGVRVRDLPLNPADALRLGGVLVAAPACTLADTALALRAAARSAPRQRLTARGPVGEMRRAFRALAADPEVVVASITWLERRVTPNKLAALGLLRRVARGDPVDDALDAVGETPVRRR
ncbi:MAG: hypothetical protein ACTHZX_02105 [Microbacterium sp.]